MKPNLQIEVNTLQCELKAAHERIRAFETGKAYLDIQELRKQDMKHLAKELHDLKAKLAEAHSKAVTARNHWFEVFEDLEKEQKIKEKAFENIIRAKDRKILRLEQQCDKYASEVSRLRKLYSKVMAELEEEQDRNVKITAQMNRNYENSSIPSSKAVTRKKIENGREKTGRKPGAQKGHEHHGRTRQTPTKTILLPQPESIKDDPDFKSTGKFITKQLVSIRLFVEATDYQAEVFYNSKTNERIHAPFPEGVVDDVNYDGTVKAFLYLLNNECCVSIDKCQRFLYDLSGGKLKISRGMINKLGKEFSELSQPEIAETFAELQTSPVINTDCTVMNVNGSTAYVYICAAPDGKALYFAREKKGHEGVKGTVVENYFGILVHDHESTFRKYGRSHQECLSHVLRYLKGSMENEPDLTWNVQTRKLLQEAIHYRNSLSEGETADPDKISYFERMYSNFMKTAEEEYKSNPPGKYYRDGYNLFLRMAKNPEQYLLFLHDLRVPATNNLSERLLRPCKRKQVQATSFRSFQSIFYLCDGMSVLLSMRQNNEANLFEQLSQVFNHTKQRPMV